MMILIPFLMEIQTPIGILIETYMERIQLNEYYRLKAKELSLSFVQMHSLIKEHNLSRGLIGESILRCFLQKVLPDIAKVSQGFVECNGVLSHQCDIIIYDRIHYVPLYSYGEIEHAYRNLLQTCTVL